MRFYMWYSTISGAVEQAVAGDAVIIEEYHTPPNTVLKELTRELYECCVMGHRHSYDSQIDVWVDGLSATSDDNQVVCDGVDVITVTIQVGGAGHNETVNLYLDQTLAGQQQVIDGICTVNVKATITGTHVLVAESTTIYGKSRFTFSGG